MCPSQCPTCAQHMYKLGRFLCTGILLGHSLYTGGLYMLGHWLRHMCTFPSSFQAGALHLLQQWIMLQLCIHDIVCVTLVVVTYFMSKRSEIKWLTFHFDPYNAYSERLITHISRQGTHNLTWIFQVWIYLYKVNIWPGNISITNRI